jgi:hypothetical protein
MLLGEAWLPTTTDQPAHHSHVFLSTLSCAGLVDPVDVLLLMAASENDSPKVEELLAAGANIYIADNKGKSPMDLASKPEVKEMLQVRGLTGADVVAAVLRVDSNQLASGRVSYMSMQTTAARRATVPFKPQQAGLDVHAVR